MKRIILGLSLLLMLVQSGFAKTDTEWDQEIANQSDQTWQQIYRCNKAVLNHQFSSNVEVCLKAKKMFVKKYGEARDIKTLNLNIGVLYEYSMHDYLKAYDYYIGAAQKGDMQAQKNLDILCRNHSWVCKQ